MAVKAGAKAFRGKTWRKARPPGTQRQRLLDAATHVAARAGYSDVTVGQIVAGAGVSRATFYEHFSDREACFAGALAPLSQQLLSTVRDGIANARAEHATRAATRALLAYAHAQPTHARLLLGEPLTGGERLRDVRDQLVDDIARLVADAHRLLPSSVIVPDLPPALICGVSLRLLAERVRDGEPCLNGLAEELLDWIAAYELPLARHHWQELTALPAPARSPFLPPGALRCPPAPAPGRQRISDEAIAENQWLRIVLATAAVIRRDGYASTTVAQITAAAGVDSRAFYRLFAGKRHALAAANELLLTRATAAAAGAFAAGQAWPQRVWEAARALTQYAEENPTLTYLSLVESHAGGAQGSERSEDLGRAFTIFLHEGDRYPHRRSALSTARPSEVALEPIGAAVSELGYRHVRAHGESRLSLLLAHIVFVSLTPFLGADAAGDVLHRQGPQAHPHALLADAA